MTRLSYKIIDGYCFLDDAFFDTAESVRLSFDGVTDGELRFPIKSCFLKDGGAKISLNALDDGKITPTLLTPKGSFAIEPFIKKGNKILPAPTEDRTIRLCIKKLTALEQRVSELEEKLREFSLELGACHFTDCD